MKEEKINDIKYKLPSALTPFQRKLYVHLINWKWKYVTKEVGIYKKKERNSTKVITYEYDAILPESVHKYYPLIYPDVLLDMLAHKKKFDFKLHQHFNHMASSQAANVNLFLPILLNANVNDVLKELKSDFKSLATDQLYKGFRIEYWDGNSKTEKGLLGDHNARSGTDSDIGIAYWNKKQELCLWLIEHKLTEKEFTECGGFKSDNRNKVNHRCEESFTNITANKNLCYYHDVRGSEYWNLTDSNQSFFSNHTQFNGCPFRGGMNQLWRNQLMALALEQTGEFKHVYFSVVHHPENHSLDKTIADYANLVSHNNKFNRFTSSSVITAALKAGDKKLNDWVNWYKELYNV